jgi:tape measure domain-containing protein
LKAVLQGLTTDTEKRQAAADAARVRTSGTTSREMIRVERERLTAVARLEGDAQRDRTRRHADEARAGEQLAREQLRTVAQAALERARLEAQAARTAGIQERERTRTSSLAMREAEREKLRTMQQTARQASRSYEESLGRGFFSHLARAATSSFREGFKVSGDAGGGGGGLLSGALSVLGGNLLTGALSKVGSELKRQITGAFDFLDVQEKAELAFAVIFRNAGASAVDAATKARAHLQELLAAEDLRRALGTDTLIELSQQLQAVGFSAEEIIPSLRAVGNAVSVYADAPARLQRIFLQLSQLTTTGQVSGEELRVLAENGVPAWKYLAEYAGKSVAQVRKLAQQGMLDARVAVKVILGGMEKDFGGLLEATKDTYSQQWRTIEELNKQRSAEAFKPAFDEAKKAQGAAIRGLESDAAKGFAQGAAGAQKAILGGFDNILSALATGDFKALGYSAVESVTQGARDAAKDLREAGAKAGQQLEEGWRDQLQQRSPSRVMFDLGLEAGRSLVDGFMQGVGGRRISGLREQLERAADLPMVQAFFEAIKKAEGGAPNRIVGGGTFSDMSRHPNRVGFVGPAGPSTAAGSYQITGTNWRRIAPALGLTDFAARNQLLAALYLFNEEGGLDKLLAGDIEGAIRAAGKDWAAVPGSPLPGRSVSRSTFLRSFEQALGQSGGSTRAALSGDIPGGLGRFATPRGPLTPDQAEQMRELQAEHDRLKLEREKYVGSVAGELQAMRSELESIRQRLAGGQVWSAEKQLALNKHGDKIEADIRFIQNVAEGTLKDLDRKLQAIKYKMRDVRAGTAAGSTGAARRPDAARPEPVAPPVEIPAPSGIDYTKLLQLPAPRVAEDHAELANRARLSYFELLKGIGRVGPEAEASFGQAGRAVDKLAEKTNNVGNLVKGEGGGLLGPLHRQIEKLNEETDFTPMQLAADTLGVAFGNLKENMLASVDAIIFSGASLKEALGAALKDTLAQAASFLGKKALLKGLEESAEALSSLAALDFRGFAQHSAAAAGWFALAGAAAIGGRAIAGAGGKGKGGARGAEGAGGQREDERPDTSHLDRFTRDSRFDLNARGGTGAMTERLLARAEAAHAAERRMMVAALNQNAEAMNRTAEALGVLESASAEDIFYRSTDAFKGALKRSVQEDVNFWQESIAKPVLG